MRTTMTHPRHATPMLAASASASRIFAPLARVLAQLEAAGYRGCYDLELIGPRIEAEGYESAIPRAVAATAALLSQVGAAAPA